jgi:hypothetical protein
MRYNHQVHECRDCKTLMNYDYFTHDHTTRECKARRAINYFENLKQERILETLKKEPK